MMNEVINHYDSLIDENNDPVHDPKPLRDYMDKWDGQEFIENLDLNESKAVLEIGMGTGRLAIRVAPLCKTFTGIDISPKTVARAKDNLKNTKNTDIICADFTEFDFSEKFDVIYSSLTFMHIEDKKSAIEKVKQLLNCNGRFVVSIDKNQTDFIDMGTRKIKIFPDSKEAISKNLTEVGFKILKQYETDFAYIFVSVK